LEQLVINLGIGDLEMKKIILTAITAATLAGSLATTAAAGWTSQRIGNFEYINGTGSNIGQSVICQRVGNFTYCN
jgi:hypothetical protein